MLDYNIKATQPILYDLFDELEFGKYGFEFIARVNTRKYCLKLLNDHDYTIGDVAYIAIHYYQGHLDSLIELDTFHKILKDDVRFNIKESASKGIDKSKLFAKKGRF